MTRTILFIHGRSFKPPRAALRRLWLAALTGGIRRDRPELLPQLRKAKKEFVYYGDLSNRFLRSSKEPHHAAADLADRKKCLARLKKLRKRDFNKERYLKLRGSRPYKEFLADTLGASLGAIGLGNRLIQWSARDMAEYWNPDSEFGSEVRATVAGPLKRSLNRKGKLLVVSHSLGTIVAYDTFWKFSRMGEYRHQYARRPIDLWITLGSPLGDTTVKRNLRGSRASGPRRFPCNVTRWENVAAEDDFISHDKRVADDYAAMKKEGLIRSIRDHTIHNLAVRNGRSNPHSSAGYLIHPTVVKLVSDWLDQS